MLTRITTGVGFQAIQQPNEPYTSGAIFWDNESRKFSIFDGKRGNEFYPTNQHIDFSESTKEILLWAAKKMDEEKKLDALCEQHKGLNDAREQFEIMRALCKP
jgi:hypothetical protein